MFWRACPDLGSLREESFRWRRPGVRAVMMREFGPPEVLEPAEVAEVRAGPDEVVIGVEFANVTFVETQVRAGRPPHPSMLPALPAILGNGVGGTVSDANPWSGLRVVASLNGTGGYAERAVTSASHLIRVPDGLATRDAVALLADGRTALALAGRAGLQAGETVLVEAAGGVQEYYDTTTDPYELDNLSGKGVPAALRHALSALENCHTGAACWAAAHLGSRYPPTAP